MPVYGGCYAASCRRVTDAHFVDWVASCRYYSPYPEPYASCEKLYVCEYTMKYFRKAKSLERHLARLQTRQPPGQWRHRCC